MNAMIRLPKCNTDLFDIVAISIHILLRLCTTNLNMYSLNIYNERK